MMQAGCIQGGIEADLGLQLSLVSVGAWSGITDLVALRKKMDTVGFEHDASGWGDAQASIIGMFGHPAIQGKRCCNGGSKSPSEVWFAFRPVDARSHQGTRRSSFRFTNKCTYVHIENIGKPVVSLRGWCQVCINQLRRQEKVGERNAETTCKVVVTSSSGFVK